MFGAWWLFSCGLCGGSSLGGSGILYAVLLMELFLERGSRVLLGVLIGLSLGMWYLPRKMRFKFMQSCGSAVVVLC